MGRRKTEAAVARTPWPKAVPNIEPFRGNLTFSAFSREHLESLGHADKTERFEALLDGIQEIGALPELEKPEWDPPEIRDQENSLDAARAQVAERLETEEAYDWDEARVWKELYLLTYADADKLRQIAQDLDDKFEERGADLEEHNSKIAELAVDARRLWLETCT
jgi:hypothetical protein